MKIVLNSIIIALAAGGFSLAFYIFRSKRANKSVACPLDGHCDAVIHSDYSKFFGIPVDLLGLLYYIIIGLSYGFLLFYPQAAIPAFVLVVLAMSFGALLFSAYLTFIQAFNIKQWCTWCLMSASICAVIFGLSYFNSGLSFMFLLSENRDIFLAIHLLAAALAFSSAILSDLLFFKFLKDFQISKFESGTLKFLSQCVWLFLGLTIMTGLAMFLPHAEHIVGNPIFKLKMTALVVIIINGSILNLIVAPRLVKASLENNPGESGLTYKYDKSDLPILGRLPFVLGPVSAISWLSVFLAGIFLGKFSGVSFNVLISVYLGLLLMGVLAGLAIRKILKGQVGRF